MAKLKDLVTKENLFTTKFRMEDWNFGDYVWFDCIDWRNQDGDIEVLRGDAYDDNWEIYEPKENEAIHTLKIDEGVRGDSAILASKINELIAAVNELRREG